FFSSRRRHTRSDRDWSSDVCSSDLDEPGRAAACRAAGAARRIPRVARAAEHLVEGVPTGGELGAVRLPEDHGARVPQPADDQGKIGRASCRERVEMAGGGGAVMTKG